MISRRVSQWTKVPVKKKKSQVVNNDGIRGGPWTGPVRAYVPICIPWSGQGRLCAGWLVGIAPTKKIAQG